MAEEVAVKVAVRVRPFNKRERQRKAKCIVKMKGNITSLVDADDPEDVKSFTYDHSYWSFDGCREREDGFFEPDPSHPNGKQFADQSTVYKDLGKGVLDSAWEGFNATLFAYGQTGSGKSWSVIGYGANKGIVPLICEDLFKKMGENEGKAQYEVHFSMLEIYNEVVRDLLKPGKGKGGLKVREHPKKGFYAEGLKSALVTSYEEIDQKMSEGTINRTIASTNMNATSSRAHTIVGIKFVQKSKNAANVESAKTALINLVDLAGSERVESTGATGDRLKEGAAINLSLTSLGNCIHALAEHSQGKTAKQVPFRSSKLTKLLKNALGGNSKTIMVAAISPADINYEETLSTLRYADRAKQIKTKAVVNEDPTEKLLRELKEENERLKRSMKTGNMGDFIDEDGDGIDDRDMEKLKAKWEEEMRAQLLENDKEIAEMKKSYEEKLRQQKKDVGDPSLKKKEEEKLKKPHIYNLNIDPQLNGRIVHILKPGATTIGNRKGKPSDITMLGPGIQEQHATITVTQNGTVNLKPGTSECRVLVNGSPLQGEGAIVHNDRIVIGSTQIWVFQNPLNKPKSAKGKKTPEITYEYAQEEIAAKNGVSIGEGNSDMASLQEEMLEVVPMVEEANSISGELDKRVKFEVLLVAPEVLGDTARSKRTEVHVKMKNLENGTEFVWPKEKFRNRLYQMKEMYNTYEDDDDWEVPEEEDPFAESLETEVHMGTAMVILTSVAHRVEHKEQTTIINYKGLEVGVLNVEVVPCNAKGKEYGEDDDVFVDSPDELIGQNLHFKVKILNGRGLSSRFKDIYCSYSLYLEHEVKTKKMSGTSNPDFNHVKQYNFTPVTAQLCDYLKSTSLVIRVMGKQQLRGSAMPKNPEGLSTREMLNKDGGVFSNAGQLNMNGRVIDPNKQSIVAELLLMKKTQARLQQKVDAVQKLVKEAENISRSKVSTITLKEVLNSVSGNQAEQIIRKHLQDPEFVDEPDAPGMRGDCQKSSSVCSIL